MRLAWGLVDIRSGLRNPVMLQIPPMTAHRIAMHVANMVMSSHHGSCETFQNDAESSRCNVEAAGLKPDTIHIRNPETVIVEVGVSNEMSAVPAIRLEAVGKTVESSDRHMAPCFVSELSSPELTSPSMIFENPIQLRRRNREHADSLTYFFSVTRVTVKISLGRTWTSGL